MPHMSNLSWIMSFLVFNLIILVLFMNVKITNTDLKTTHNITSENKKEWQW